MANSAVTAVEQEIIVITCHITRNSPLFIRLGLGKLRRAEVLVVFPRPTENIKHCKISQICRIRQISKVYSNIQIENALSKGHAKMSLQLWKNRCWMKTSFWNTALESTVMK
jgi:hypothetical protein